MFTYPLRMFLIHAVVLDRPATGSSELLCLSMAFHCSCNTHILMGIVNWDLLVLFLNLSFGMTLFLVGVNGWLFFGSPDSSRSD